jgi:hypothetical protein
MGSETRWPDEVTRINTVLETLCHPIRREVIYHYEQGDRTGSVTELAVALAGRMPLEAAETLRVQLVHTHLPKLADNGWIQYDRDTELITYEGHETAKQLLGEVQQRL